MENIYNYLVVTINLISQSRFGNKLVLKGGSVLMSKLMQIGREDLLRNTTDIDIHCDKKDTWVDFYTNIEAILNNNNLGLIYKINKRRSIEKGLDTSDSLKFLLTDTIKNRNVKFKIDMNIKNNALITCEFSPLLNMSTYDCETMLSDKIVVVSSQKVFRRIKDVYDLAVLSSIKSYSYKDIANHIAIKHGNIELKNMLTIGNFSDLQHAYERYDAIQHRYNLKDIINIDVAFLQPFYMKYNGELIWNHLESRWVQN